MKILVYFFVLGLAAFVLGSGAQAANTSAATGDSYSYDIKGMKCGDCVDKVKSGVCGMKGIEKCDVSVGHLQITTQPGTHFDPKAVVAAVKKAGHYSVKDFKKMEASANTDTQKTSTETP